MLLSGVESAALLPAPDPFLVFCLFNLIMALLLLSSSVAAKPSAPPPREPADLGGLAGSSARTQEVADGGAETGDGGADAGGCWVASGAASLEENRGLCRGAGEEASDGGDCEELNRRADEFIVRMNRAWVAEREVMRSPMAVGGELGPRGRIPALVTMER